MTFIADTTTEAITLTDLEKWETEIAEQTRRLQLAGANGPLAEYMLTILQDGLVRCQRRRDELKAAQQEELTCSES